MLDVDEGRPLTNKGLQEATEIISKNCACVAMHVQYTTQRYATTREVQQPYLWPELD